MEESKLIKQLDSLYAECLRQDPKPNFKEIIVKAVSLGVQRERSRIKVAWNVVEEEMNKLLDDK